MSKKSRKQVGQDLFEGNEFLKGVLQYIPEDRRDNALEYLGEHAMLRSDYSRAHEEAQARVQQAEAREQEANAFKVNLDNWYAQNQQMIARALTIEKEHGDLSREVSRLRAAVSSGGEVPPAPEPAPQADLTPYLKRDEAVRLLQQEMNQSRQAAWVDASTITRLATRHLREFGEELDPNAVLAHAQRIRANDLPSAYESMFADKIQAKREEAEAARHKALEDKIREQVRAEYTAKGSSPYPVPDSAEPLNALAGLSSKDKEQFGLAAALNELNNMRRSQV